MTAVEVLRAALLPAVVAGTAAALLVGLPRPAASRLGRLHHGCPGLPRHAPVPAIALAAAGSPLLLLGTDGVVLAPVAAAGALLGLRWSAARRRAAADRSERARAAEACAALASELRSGRAAHDALDAAALVAGPHTAAALGAAGAAARLGADVPRALVAAQGQAAPEEVRRALTGLAACWSVCASAGGGLASAVDRLADGVRAAEQQRRAVDAELAGPRATALLLAALPVGGLLLATGLGGEPWQFLLGTPAGAGCLAAGLGLDAAGLLWTRRLVARAGR